MLRWLRGCDLNFVAIGNLNTGKQTVFKPHHGVFNSVCVLYKAPYRVSRADGLRLSTV